MDGNIPRYIQWSAERVDLNDPFQRRWLLRQILMHGRAEDIRKLDMGEVSRELDNLQLPADLYRLWNTFLETRHDRRTP